MIDFTKARPGPGGPRPVSNWRRGVPGRACPDQSRHPARPAGIGYRDSGWRVCSDVL